MKFARTCGVCVALADRLASVLDAAISSAIL